MKTIIKNGQVALPEGIQAFDVLLEHGRIEGIGQALDDTGARVIDASGAYVLPGFIDFHTHLEDRIGGLDLAETYESGSRIAALNGITTLCGFITQGPKETLNEALARTMRKAVQRCHVDQLWHVTPTSFAENDWKQILALPGRGYKTVKLYTTYRNAGLYSDYEKINTLFQRLAGQDFQFLVHAEDDGILQKNATQPLEYRKAIAHAALRNPEAEWVAVQQVLELAKRHGAKVHFVHISTLEAAQAIQAARNTQAVTCETCPQYLWLDESWLEKADGHRWLCSPPLRKDREAFRALARQGAFDIFASDHCPFHHREKDAWAHKDIRRVPGGIPGIGALPHLAWRLWEAEPDVAARELAKRLSETPARLAGLSNRKGAIRVGLDGDLVVLDPACPQKPIISSLSNCHESYPGFLRSVGFRHVLLRGKSIVVDGRLVEGIKGRLLQG